MAFMDVHLHRYVRSTYRRPCNCYNCCCQLMMDFFQFICYGSVFTHNKMILISIFNYAQCFLRNHGLLAVVSFYRKGSGSRERNNRRLCRWCTTTSKYDRRRVSLAFLFFAIIIKPFTSKKLEQTVFPNQSQKLVF